jgi:hypothetical protein
VPIVSRSATSLIRSTICRAMLVSTGRS